MKILAVTGTRADWGLIEPVLSLLQVDPRFRLRIVATGQHLAPGNPSLAAIEAEGFAINYRVDMGLGAEDSPAVIAQAMGKAMAGMGAVLEIDRPDMVLLLGDRYEILAVASAALLARVPVAHLCGGDVTEGAIDDAMRHAITKMSALHFVTNAEAAARVLQLGEDSAYVVNSGSPGLDRIRRLRLLPRDDIFAAIGLAPRARNFIITFHPPTLADDADGECQAMLDALALFPDAGLVFTGSNSDPGARQIELKVREFAEASDHAVFHPSLGSSRYLSLLAQVDVVIGNSSSGLYEAPSFRVPTVNIGDRQARRTRAASVVDCEPRRDAILAAINTALETDCSQVQNPYGDGYAAERIVNVLARIKDPQRLVRKSFVDLPK